MRKDVREISQLECLPEGRRLGNATELLTNICKEADSKKMILMLTVEPFGDGPQMTKEQLMEWYESTFGFLVIQAEPLILARMSNPSPKSGLTEKIGQIIIEGIK